MWHACTVCVCVDRELHMPFCYMRITLYVVSSEPQVHASYVRMYTHFFIRTHVCIGYTRTQYNLCTELRMYTIYSLTK